MSEAMPFCAGTKLRTFDAALIRQSLVATAGFTSRTPATVYWAARWRASAPPIERPATKTLLRWVANSR